MKRALAALLLVAGFLPAARAQFALFSVDGGTERPVGDIFDLGKVPGGDAASVHFRLRNTSSAPATITLFRVAGAGFSLTASPTLPVTLNPQAAADFTIAFSAPASGSYSADLSSDGISAILVATVVPGLTYTVETGAGKIVLGNAPVDFGSVEVGQGKALRFDIDNQTALPLATPAITVSSGDFVLTAEPAAGVLLPPGTETGFDMQFRPRSAGPRKATVSIASRTYGLTGTGLTPSFPKPQLFIDLSQKQSAQQGSVRVTFDSAALSSGTGTVTLDFQAAQTGAADPAIGFASGGRTATFTFGSGDTQGHFDVQTAASFQTGTTAGTLMFTARLGALSDQQLVSIAAAPVGVAASQATRAAGNVQIQLTGFDNTRTAGALTFTFFDASGSAVAPGQISADATSAFSAYFQQSNSGGSFLLRAQFPVTGDAAQIAAFEASVSNQAGTTTTVRTPF